MGLRENPWEIPNTNKVKLLAPICVKYGHKSLEEIHGYMSDFGLVKTHEELDEEGTKCAYYRGFGVQPTVYIAAENAERRFYGIYFEAASEKDLHKAAKIAGASEIRPFLDGKEVTITDPNGTPFHVAFGYTKREFTPRENEIMPINYPAPADTDSEAKPRRGVGQHHRLTKGPVPIHKLGHCGYVVKSIDESCDFYTQNFNLKPSDVILGQNEEVDMIFLHVDLGKEYSEHHSFFIIRPMGPQPIGSPHHAAFEVESLDTTFVGHEYLKSKGYTNFWGVGRHIESSQVFDYWLDLDGFLLEHYADGDLVNEDHPISWIPPRPFVMTNNWGPGPDFSVLAPPPTVG